MILHTLTWLWQNRERPRWGSRRWLKAWAKRALTAPTLASSLMRLAMLAARGAKIEFPAVIGKCAGNGAWRHLTMGRGSFVGRVELQLHDRVIIGQNVIINDGARLLTGSHDVGSADFELKTAPISLRDYAWVATGAIILPGVTIGRGAVVAAGAVVTKDVPDYAIAVGNPARLLNRRRPRNLRYQPLRHLAMIEAWLGRCHEPAPANESAAAA